MQPGALGSQAPLGEDWMVRELASLRAEVQSLNSAVVGLAAIQGQQAQITAQQGTLTAQQGTLTAAVARLQDVVQVVTNTQTVTYNNGWATQFTIPKPSWATEAWIDGYGVFTSNITVVNYYDCGATYYAGGAAISSPTSTGCWSSYIGAASAGSTTSAQLRKVATPGSTLYFRPQIVNAGATAGSATITVTFRITWI